MKIINIRVTVGVAGEPVRVASGIDRRYESLGHLVDELYLYPLSANSATIEIGGEFVSAQSGEINGRTIATPADDGEYVDVREVGAPQIDLRELWIDGTTVGDGLKGVGVIR